MGGRREQGKGDRENKGSRGLKLWMRVGVSSITHTYVWVYV